VVADEAYGRAIPSAFLDKLATEFTSKYPDKAAGAKEASLNSSFGCVYYLKRGENNIFNSNCCSSAGSS
jgi:hypothetical protein